MSKISHHFFVPHRDDAFLTFGGFILSTLASGDRVVVHVFYGKDGYLQESFKKELSHHGKKHPHLKHIKKSLDPSFCDIFENINRIIASKKIEDHDWLTLGIMVRRLEENLVAKIAGYELKEYNYRCGYPLRAYPNFNSPVRPDDLREQTDILIAVIKKLIVEENKDGKDLRCYFPSGIGGHPDHIILANLGKIINRKFKDKVQDVIFGQDMPYALIPEWFARSEILCLDYEKVLVDITEFLPEKLEILNLYRSQLTPEDLRLAALYPLTIGKMVSRDYPVAGLGSLLDDSAFEVQYKLK